MSRRTARTGKAALKVYISSASQKTFFISCVKEVAEKRGDEPIYTPDIVRDLDDVQILEKVKRELRASHVILMDVSMKNIDNKWYPNPGVMIEFGLAVKDPTKGLSSVYFFCDESTDRHQLPPMIPRIEVQKYSENDDNLKKFIEKSLDDFEGKAFERLHRALEAQAVAEMMYETKKIRSN